MSSCYWRPHSGRCVRSPKPKRPYKLQEGRLHWGFVLFRMMETAILEKTIIKMLGVNTAWYHLMPFDISTLQPSSFLQVKQHLQHLIQEVPCSKWCVMFPSFASKKTKHEACKCVRCSQRKQRCIVKILLKPEARVFAGFGLRGGSYHKHWGNHKSSLV